MARPGFEIFHKRQTFEVNKLVIIPLVALFIQAHKQHVGIMGEQN